MTPFLLEMGVEEIPTAYLGLLVEQLDRAVRAGLDARRLAHREVRSVGTPRRLAVFGEVAARQQARARRVKGPPLDRARTAAGDWTEAARGFSRRLGLPLEELREGDGDEAGYVVALITEPEHDARALLPGALEDAVAALSPPRTMRWSAEDVRFVRPVRWLVALLGPEVMPVKALSLAAGRTTHGNRTDFPAAFPIEDAGSYPAQMHEHHVELCHQERARRIVERGEDLARTAGGVLARYPGLLDEVADLVEWPVPFVGRFDPAALTLPRPILETAMAHHQRYFPVQGPDRGLLAAFVGVRNGEGADLEGVVAGNQKVLKARLDDARFFFLEDRKRSLASRVDDLDRVVFHRDLGTFGDKRRRVEALAREIGPELGLDPDAVAHLGRGAALAKTDLLTHVVGEFPELQGTMGGIYAALDHEPEPVIAAVAGQYHPVGPDDELPAGAAAEALSLLDRLDTLAGMAAHGLRPTASEDPFGFRRAGLGAARILMEGHLAAIDAERLVRAAVARHGPENPESATAEVMEFLMARVRGYFQGRVRADLVEAALFGEAPWNTLADRLTELGRRIEDGDFERMAVTFKRVKNLAGDKAPELREHYPDAAEAALARALGQAAAATSAETGAGAAYWDAVAALHGPVAAFFDAVLVMDPDDAVRERRLGLLAAVGRFLSRGADLARITGERGRA